MSRPTPPPSGTPTPAGTMCDRYAAAIEQAAATGFVPTDERKAAISGWLAQCAMTLSAAAHAWLTLHGIE